jgi:hypothetical protein
MRATSRMRSGLASEDPPNFSTRFCGTAPRLGTVAAGRCRKTVADPADALKGAASRPIGRLAILARPGRMSRTRTGSEPGIFVSERRLAMHQSKDLSRALYAIAISKSLISRAETIEGELTSPDSRGKVSL